MMSLRSRWTIGCRVALPILFLVLGAAGCQKETAPKVVVESPRNVRVLKLAAGNLAEYFEVSGPVAPVRGTDLSAQESGPVVALAAAKGAKVGQGDVIIELERSILRAERDAAAADLAAQSFNVDKVRRLHQAGKVSEIELLTAESTFAQAQSRAEVTAERYRRGAVRAPFDGVVTDRYVELGQLVVPGMPVVRVVDPYTLKLEAYLTDEEVRWVHVGESAAVTLGAVEGAVSGKVAWVGFEADRATGKFQVEIELPNADLRLRSGVIGRARLPKTVRSRIVSIPRDAVVTGSTGPTAFVVAGGRAVRRTLSLGAAQGLMVEVKAGLSVGDSLVVRGQRELRAGNLVLVSEVAERADGAMAADPGVVTGAGVGSRVAGAGQ